MNTRDLQAFVAVVESGSMIRAAERLFLTQPGLTRRVQNLETILGTELLDRQSKPLKPTAAGNEVYSLARNVLRAVEDLMAVASPDSEPTGEMKIGVPPFLSDLALEHPIDRLRSAFPKLTLRVTAGWSPGLLENVERTALDMAVVLMPASIPLPDTLITTLLGCKPTIIVAPRSFGLTDQPKTLAELSGYPWVLNQDGCGMRSTLSRAMSTAGLSLNVAVEAFGSDLQLSLVARGLGVGLTTPEVLERSPNRASLQLIEATDFKNVLNIWLVHGALPGRLVRPVALLRDVLLEKLESTG
ncbi:LysR family transcriptional regulator [Paraburkholderia humisilvae]|uniref:HTH-type transcriptional regulator CysB n=1 Tax=Paraburkholderia humisilvae TaxID=627669 RepID=A0A6J5DU69_9BURK|nr:LysR family transcriptional regulator [Paraburkholderia humisilvae]CAB3756435.1 HTH-type transcriptional regulator CysB [Paraburkholderia humisilvae]